MTLEDALQIVIERTGVERYRYLCLEQPDEAERLVWSDWIIAQAQNKPSFARKAVTLFDTLKTWIKSGAPIADRTERARRRSICEHCPRFDAEMKRCTVCGCSTSIKPWLRTATCPEGRWESV